MTEKLEYDRNVGMLRYKTTPEDIRKVMDQYNAQFGKSNILNGNTIYNKKESRIAGLLGELVYKILYPEAIKSEQDITYDFDHLGRKVDVKCKYRTVKPNLNFEASFFKYQSSKSFNADEYVFMSTIPSFEYVWLCGHASKDEILNNPHAEIWRAGDTDNSNGMHFKEDTICLKYKYLNQLELKGNN